MPKLSVGGYSSKVERETNDSFPIHTKVNTVAHVFTIAGDLHIDPSERRKLFASQIEEWAKGFQPFAIVRNYDRLYKDYKDIHGDLLVILSSLALKPYNLKVRFDGKDYLVIHR